jgi:hypothetical protein
MNPHSPQFSGSSSVFVQPPDRQHVGLSPVHVGPIPQKHSFSMQALPDGPQFLFTQQTPVTQEPLQQICPESQTQLSIPPQPSGTEPQVVPSWPQVRGTHPGVGEVAQRPAPSRTRPLQHGLPRFGGLPTLVHASLRLSLSLRFLRPRPRCASAATRLSPPLLRRAGPLSRRLPPLPLPDSAAAAFWPSSVPPRSVPNTARAASRRERDALKSRVRWSNTMSSSAGILLVSVQRHSETRSSGDYAFFGAIATPATRSAFPVPNDSWS